MFLILATLGLSYGHGGHGLGHGHSHGINVGGSSTMTALRDFFTILALSFHAVFEGLAVGLEDSIEGVWTLFAAVATHKYVIAFCVGIELVSVGTPLAFFLTYIIVFAVMTPVGIGIGLAVSELAVDSNRIGYAAATGTMQGNFFHLLKLFYPVYLTCISSSCCRMHHLCGGI